MNITQSGMTIIGPSGQQTVTGTINITNARNVRWYGLGTEPSTRGTRFQWGGNATDPMFQLSGSRQCEFANFAIWASSVLPLAVGIGQSPNAGGLTTNNSFKNLIIQSNDAGGINIGMRWYGNGGNNDASLLERVTCLNYTTSAYSIEASQSKSHLFQHCQAVGGTSSQIGINCINGSFIAVNMLGANNADSDFVLGSPDDTINILGGDFENSGRLLRTSGATSTGWPVLIQGVRWAANKINADNKVVIYQHRNGLTFSNNLIEAGPGFPIISLEPSSTSQAVAFSNVIFWNTATANSQPFVSSNGNTAGTWNQFGNSVIDHTAGILYPITSTI